MARQDNDDGEYDNEATHDHWLVGGSIAGVTILLSCSSFRRLLYPLCYRSNGQLSAASTVRLAFHRCKIQDNPLPSIS
jgi:hypothetical protein